MKITKLTAFVVKLKLYRVNSDVSFNAAGACSRRLENDLMVFFFFDVDKILFPGIGLVTVLFPYAFVLVSLKQNRSVRET